MQELPSNLNNEIKAEMKKKKSLFNVIHDDWGYISKFVIDDLDNKPIRPENKYLKENERNCIRNEEWLNFACEYFQTTEEEKSNILKDG